MQRNENQRKLNISGVKETRSNPVLHHKCASTAHGVSHLNDRYLNKSKFKISAWIRFYYQVALLRTDYFSRGTVRAKQEGLSVEANMLGCRGGGEQV